MKTDLIIYNAAQLLTCASSRKPKKGAEMKDLSIIENGAAAILDGKIAAVGETKHILDHFSAKETFDAGGMVVTPGFVECHTHLVFAGDRLEEFELKIKGADYLEILKNGGGILSTVRRTRAASIEDLIETSAKRLDKLLAFGVTTCEIKTGYGLDTESELKMLEAIIELNESHPIELVPTFLPAHAVPPEFKENPDAYVALICREMLPSAAKLLADRGFTGKFYADVFCEKNAFDLIQSKQVLEAARSLGFGIKAHVDEFTNLGGARMAIGLDADSIDHLDAISDEEIKMLASSETIGVVTPTVNFNFGSCDFANARKFIDENCAVALSTDYNPGSAPCPSLPNAMAIACRYQKLLPAEAFNAATINAAFAVGRGSEIGSLEAGKAADILMFDTKDYREIIYEFGGNFIEQVWKSGTAVYEKV